MSTKVCRLGAVATSLILAGSGFGVSPANSAVGAADCDVTVSGEELTTSEVPGGTDVVECGFVGEPILNGEGLSVEIPPPGEGVDLRLDLVNGDALTFSVATSVEGDISYDSTGDAEASEVGSGDYLDEGEDDGGRTGVDTRGCDSSSFISGSTGGRRTPTSLYNYRVGDGPRPAGLSDAATREVIFDSFATWRNSTNSCGMADSVDVNYRYDGTTTLETGISTAAACTGRDGTSIIDFGTLPFGTLGANCSYPNSSRIYTESDIRLNTKNHSWTTTPRINCTNKYDVQSIMTHEIGHSWGLNDLKQAGTRYQTMFGTSYSCMKYQRTLARGDVTGMNQYY